MDEKAKKLQQKAEVSEEERLRKKAIEDALQMKVSSNIQGNAFRADKAAKMFGDEALTLEIKVRK
jgi:hypothetical protein